MPRSLAAPVLSALIAGVMIAGCSETSPDPTTAPPSGPADQSSAPGAPVDDPPGALACGRAVSAVRAATLMNPGVIAAIAVAAGTADAPVADAVQALSAAYTGAVAARGTDAEPDAVAAVSAAGAELVKICNDSGLETTG